MDSDVLRLDALPFVRWADRAVLPPGRRLADRRIYDHELVYVVAGEGAIVVAGERLPAEPDTLFLIQPGVVHSFEAQDARPLDHLGVHFDFERVGDGLAYPVCPSSGPLRRRIRDPRDVPRWDLRAQPRLDLSGRPRVRQLMDAVIAEYGTGAIDSPDLASALLVAAFIQIGREAVELRGIPYVSGPDVRRRAHRARHLLEHTSDPVEDVAHAVGWSSDHLRRVFRNVFQCAPLDIRSEARIRRAKELLRQPSTPVSEVARAAGFDDAGYFARAFRARTGLTPTQFASLARRGESGLS